MITDTDNNNTEAAGQPEAADKPGIETDLFSRDPARQAAALRQLGRDLGGLRHRIHDYPALRVCIAAHLLGDAARICGQIARALTPHQFRIAATASLITVMAASGGLSALLHTIPMIVGVPVVALGGLTAGLVVFAAIQYWPPRINRPPHSNVDNPADVDSIDVLTGIADQATETARVLRNAANRALQQSDTAPMGGCVDAATHAEAAADILNAHLAPLNGRPPR